MRTLKPLSKIFVPEPKENQTYAKTLMGKEFSFYGLKALLGAADLSKAGDRMAGLAPRDALSREAARSILSSLTLEHLYQHPLTNKEGKIDSIMRVNYEIDLEVFKQIKGLTLGELKDFLLKNEPQSISQIGFGLTGIMAAALAKLCDLHELIFLAKKFRRSAKARIVVGLPGTLSSRVQPNHPTDDLRGITLLTYIGLSLGMGDAIIGLNPAKDSVDNVHAILNQLHKIRSQTGAPTQICVLGHIKTQLQALEQGAPVEILFQSLAGTDCTLVEEFDVTVNLLDHAYQKMGSSGPLRHEAPQFMYFETGQGSEVSYGKHNGIDMTTCEALCYGLARRYDPFLVNNVTGFIGPETHLDNFEMVYSNLQDHLMGKLLGLPMGMAPCYTLHSNVTQEGQQMAIALLTAAGANYYMDVYLSIDRMLAYFDTSGHDVQTMRELYDLKPAPAFLEWALSQGIYQKGKDGSIKRGPNWGNPRIFCKSEAEFASLLEALPSAHGFENAGPRPENSVSRTFLSNLAVGREATRSTLNLDVLKGIPFRLLASEAKNREEHYRNPDRGAHLSKDALSQLKAEANDVQILITDGLSAEAVHHNVPTLLPVLLDGLKAHGVKVGEPLVVPYGRVKLAESVGDALCSRLVINLIGERPGGDAESSRSLSAYLAFRLCDPEDKKRAFLFSGNKDIRYEYTVISNIYSGSLPPLEAGSVIVEKSLEILEKRAAGNRLESLR